MAEVREIQEVETVETRRSGFMFPFIMFLLGGALIAAVVVAVLNVHSIIAWPAGQVNLGPNSTVADSGTATIPPPPDATAPSVIAPPVTEPALNAAPPQETTPPEPTSPATTGDSENPVTSAPADPATPPE